MIGKDLRSSVLLAIQNALLGAVSANLRAVTLQLSDDSVHFDAYFDGPPTEDDEEAMAEVETELWAAFSEPPTFSHSDHTWPYPKPIPKDTTWVYLRSEKLSEANPFADGSAD